MKPNEMQVPDHVYNISWLETTPRCKTPLEFIGRWLDSPHLTNAEYPLAIVARECCWLKEGPSTSRLQRGKEICRRVVNNFGEAVGAVVEFYINTQKHQAMVEITYTRIENESN